MRRVKLPVSEIIEFLGDEVLKVFGPIDDIYIDNLADAKHVNEYTLDWINSRCQGKQTLAENSPSRVVLTDCSVEYTDNMIKDGKTLIHVVNPRRIMIIIAQQYFLDKKIPGIHSSAVIDDGAIISSTAYIGAGCVVGKVRIGENTVIMPNVVIYDDVTIGDNCVIQSGAIIGTDGLGCSRDEEGRLTKFPHLGGVLIGNDVEIGANSQIARGSLSDTIIKDGCKLNGLCFIAHNCVLEENVWITGNTMLCGSVSVGKNTTIYSSVIIRDQRQIGDNCIIGMGSVVTKNIPSGETWLGNPARKVEK